MEEDRPFAGAPDDSHEAIMRATFVALQRHGYAGLSIQRIADEAELSKSTFYHHFDDKEDLLLSFAEFMLEQFITVLSIEASDDPRETLETLVDIVIDEEFPSVAAETPATTGEWDVLGAYVEVRAQAVRDEQFRAAFTEMDQLLFEQIAEVVRQGVDRGVFREVDPDAVAAMVLTLLGGHMFGVATSDEVRVEAVRRELDHYLQARVFVDD
jgi:AcrR family transcriptional regulator